VCAGHDGMPFGRCGYPAPREESLWACRGPSLQPTSLLFWDSLKSEHMSLRPRKHAIEALQSGSHSSLQLVILMHMRRLDSALLQLLRRLGLPLVSRMLREHGIHGCCICTAPILHDKRQHFQRRLHGLDVTIACPEREPRLHALLHRSTRLCMRGRKAERAMPEARHSRAKIPICGWCSCCYCMAFC
jgi:hypothetical protein